MWRVSCALVLSALGVASAQRSSGYGASSYEEELLRRQYELQQQQRLRQMQQQGGQQQRTQAQAQAQQRLAQQQLAQQQLAQQQAQQAAMRQAQYEAAQRDAYVAAQQRDEAQQRARGSGGYASGTKPMSNKDKKKALKQQEEAAKRRQKELAARQKAFNSAQKKAQRTGGGYGRRAVAERSNPLSFLFSLKGAAMTGVAGYLFVAQRELLGTIGGMLLKYPLLLIKLLVYQIIKLRGGGPSTLPGGTY